MPDLNSVPASPHSLAISRRQSQQQLQQTHASTHNPSDPSINILPSNQSAVNHIASTSVPSPQLTATQPPPQNAADAGVGPGPGPTRHPRPLTASELHAQLEKEQEAVVNRLTRELTLLRAQQNASVVSNASSTSATASNPTHDPIADSSLLSGSGFTIPTSRRHHRNSSSASQSAGGAQLISSSYEARIHAPRPTYYAAAPLSRQSSSTSRRSQNNSPVPSSSLDPSSYFHNQRVPAPTSVPASSVAPTPGSIPSMDQLSPGLMPATQRYEETAYYRNELEVAKKENEALKRRIRELERQVRTRRESDASRPRSESASTTASVNVPLTGGASIAGPRDSAASGQRTGRERSLTAQSVEGVRVGESAASSTARQE